MLPLLIWCLTIFWLSSQSTVPAPFWFDHQDKLYHAAGYAILGWCWWIWRGKASDAAWVAGILFCSLYGISDEWHQSFVAGRDSSVGDWLADTLGASAMLWALQQRWLATRQTEGSSG